MAPRIHGELLKLGIRIAESSVSKYMLRCHKPPSQTWRTTLGRSKDEITTYDEVIRRFGEATGVPVILNTSFNRSTEPIVASPADAYRTFANSGIDMLVLNRFVVQK